MARTPNSPPDLRGIVAPDGWRYWYMPGIGWVGQNPSGDVYDLAVPITGVRLRERITELEARLARIETRLAAVEAPPTTFYYVAPPALHGYTCPHCGGWVRSGSGHSCTTSLPEADAIPSLPLEGDVHGG